MDLFDGPDDFLGGDDAPSDIPADLAGLVADLNEGDAGAVFSAFSQVRERGLGQLQEQVVVAMHRLTAELGASVEQGKSGLDAALDCLDAVGDGRCVRPMERLLHDRKADLSEHQAWRARHIVQRIRRFGRK